MIETIPATGLISLRDRALLLMGFAAALRRSELVALDAGDIETCDEGIRLHIRRSKTDVEGVGATIAIPTGHRLRPVQAIREWLQAARITEGAIFRPVGKGGRLALTRLSDRAVALIVKSRAEAAGLDPAQFSGHSLRAGFITSAAACGASVFKMQAVSRHKTLDVLSGYVRDAEAFKDHAGSPFL
jgi:site-specific recombinase XerD